MATASEVAAYLAEQSEELAARADRAGLGELAYIFKMAGLEARTHACSPRVQVRDSDRGVAMTDAGIR